MNNWDIAYLTDRNTVIVSNGSVFVEAYYDWYDNPKVDIRGAAPDIIFFEKLMTVRPAAGEQITDRQRKLADAAIAEIQKDPVLVQAMTDEKARQLKEIEDDDNWDIAYLSGDDTVIVSNGSVFVEAIYDWDDNPKVNLRGAAPDIIYFRKWMPVRPAAGEQITDRQRKLADFAIAEIQKDPVLVQAMADEKARKLERLKESRVPKPTALAAPKSTAPSKFGNVFDAKYFPFKYLLENRDLVNRIVSSLKANGVDATDEQVVFAISESSPEELEELATEMGL